MKKLIAVFCCAVMLTLPAMADRTGGTMPGNNGAPNSVGDFDIDYCKTHQDECRGGTKKHAKKSNHTGTIIVASVAGAAVFAGVMWYVFKKKPSDNNPGQVKLAEF